MKHYLAPLEGITGYIYRNAFHNTFGNKIDKYFTPFIATCQEGVMKPRELQDVLPEHNVGLHIVPQLLSNRAVDFIRVSTALKQLGYSEVNLNLGCPYATVVSKGKGAGFLSDTVKLEGFLDAVFEAGITEISIKTRTGVESPEEFAQLIKLFNRFPVKELIVHPRIRNDFYKNKPDLAAYQTAVLNSANPVCYNGDIFTVKDYHEFKIHFPDTGSMMLGRGLLANPGLLERAAEGKRFGKQVYKEFHNKIFEDYSRILSPNKNVLFKMKELWNYMRFLFPESDKYIKEIRKSQNSASYLAAVNRLFLEMELNEEAGFEGEN